MTMALDYPLPPAAFRKPWRLRTAALAAATVAHGSLTLFLLQTPSTLSSVVEGQEVAFVRDGDAALQTSSDSAPTDQTMTDAGAVDQAAADAQAAAAPTTPPPAAVAQIAMDKPDVVAPEAIGVPLAEKPPEEIREEKSKPVVERTDAVVETKTDETSVDKKAEAASAATAAAEESAASAASADRTGAIDGKRVETAASRASYGAKVLAEVQKRMFYPARARNAGVVGDAVVVFTVGAEGRIIDRRIARSTGSDALDEAALKMLDSVQAAPPPMGRFYGKTTIRFAIKG